MEAIKENAKDVGGTNLKKFWKKKLRVGQSSNVSDPYPELKLGFHILFNNQGHIGMGPQHFNLWDSNPQR